MSYSKSNNRETERECRERARQHDTQDISYHHRIYIYTEETVSEGECVRGEMVNPAWYGLTAVPVLLFRRPFRR